MPKFKSRKIYLIREKEIFYGGAEKYLSRLIKYLGDHNYDYEVIYSPFSPKLPSWLRVIFFNFYLCLIKKNKFYLSLERIACPDIYRAGDGVHKVFLEKLNKKKINPLHYIYLRYERKCFEKSKLIIANSEMIKQEIIDHYSINKEKIKVIYNGFDGYDVVDKSKLIKVREAFKIHTTKKIFLFVGSGFKRKGLIDFLEIFSKLDPSTTHAIIIGSDKNENSYKKLASDLGIKNIVFLGKRRDMEIFYELSDFVMLPTYYDPFANIVLEAMISKNIVITTRQNGAHEILNNDLVMDSPGDRSIIKKIENIISSNEEINRIKTENYNLAREFTVELNARKTFESIMETC